MGCKDISGLHNTELTDIQSSFEPSNIFTRFSQVCLWRCTIKWCTITWYIIKWCTITWCTIKWCTITWCTIKWCTVTWYIITWCTIKRCTVTWCTIKWCTITWYTIKLILAAESTQMDFIIENIRPTFDSHFSPFKSFYLEENRVKWSGMTQKCRIQGSDRSMQSYILTYTCTRLWKQNTAETLFPA